MFCSVLSAAFSGVECVPIRVEADVSNGLPVWNMVGYLSSQVKEAQERVRTAVKNAGISIPVKRITINLAPAGIRKDGTGFDLPIAAAMLCASGELPEKSMEGIMLAGELSLDGRIHGVKGVLPLAEAAGKAGCRACIVPAANYEEAVMLETVPVIGVGNLKEFIELCGQNLEETARRQLEGRSRRENKIPLKLGEEGDFSDIRGQENVKRAAVIAAAGFHNFLITGPQGTGKTMIAQRMPGILPPLTKEEEIEISRIHSIAGLLSQDAPYQKKRPFRSPHHTISPQALAGGGRIPKPGELTLAHKGILFLDEFPEFSHESIEILRQPLEEHRIYISRIGGAYNLPAHCMLVAAMNHCPCGHFPDMHRCSCTEAEIRRYQKRVCGPVLDRIDIRVEASRLAYKELYPDSKGTGTREMQKQTASAYKIQKKRYQQLPIQFNSELGGKLLEEYCCMHRESRELLEKSCQKWNLSARACHNILKTARTIADLEESIEISPVHMGEAVCYRC